MPRTDKIAQKPLGRGVDPFKRGYVNQTLRHKRGAAGRPANPTLPGSTRKNSYSKAHRSPASMAPGKTVLATGAFDILHPGHLRFLEEAKKKAGPRARLIVVVARDSTIKRRKGRKPVMPEEQRREIVAALKPVNKAILGHQEVDFLGILKQVKPDIVCVGHDQNDIKKAVARIIKHERLPIKVVQVRRFGPAGFNSSTGLKTRVLRSLSRA